MADSPIIRPARREDILAAYAVFRRSIYDYLRRIGLVSEAEAKDPPIESAWRRHAAWIEHFWDSAAENWVAADGAGRILGWALSIERSGHLELTHFFIEPGANARGIGKSLLARAFPADRFAHKSIVATQDAAALALYLRTGVSFVTTAVDIVITARPAARETELTMRRAAGEPADIAAIAAIEERVLGLRRERDLEFLLGNRPAWIALRNGAPVGYAFGAQPFPVGVTDFPPTCGPMAALDPADLPDILDQVLASEPAGVQLALGVPMSNRTALSHLLAAGGKIDPFYAAVLSSGPDMQLDRYVHTVPMFIL
jgi:GNAT superfamily N-acetyltransferase